MRLDARSLCLVASGAQLLLAIACGSTPVSAPATSERPVAFIDEGSTTRSAYTGTTPKVEARTSGDRRLVIVYQGQQRTGGFSVHVDTITIDGGTLRVRATFATPPAGAFVTEALTSPSQTVEVPLAFSEVVLLDQDGRERSRSAGLP